MSIWEIYIFMDETVEIEVAEQIGSSSRAVSRTGSSDLSDPHSQHQDTKYQPRSPKTDRIHMHHILNHEKGGNPT
jgi:Uri superfamily endonuclease